MRSPWLPWLFVGLLLATQTAAAASLRVQAERAEGGKAARIETELHLPYPPELVCTVMTDYAHMSEFVPDMTLSRVLESDSQRRLVEWQGDAGFLLFHLPVEVVLEVLRREGGLDVRSQSGNMDYRGSTRFFREDQNTVVNQEILIRPDFPIPVLLGPALVARQIRRQLEGLIVEMDRRSESWRPRQTDDWCRFNVESKYPAAKG